MFLFTLCFLILLISYLSYNQKMCSLMFTMICIKMRMYKVYAVLTYSFVYFCLCKLKLLLILIMSVAARIHFDVTEHPLSTLSLTKFLPSQSPQNNCIHFFMNTLTYARVRACITMYTHKHTHIHKNNK